jgi:hypothetical protein
VGRTWTDLVGLNIVNIGAGLVAFLLFVSWGRAVRGFWPGKKKILVFVTFIVAVVIGSNGLYLYFRYH